jgi:ribosomal protein L9
MANTKLILTHEVSGLGSAGDIVEVKGGYARNYLVPQGLATAWTRGGQKQVDQIAKARKARAAASLEEAQAHKARLEAQAVRLSVRTGQAGRLFGSVSTADVAAAVERRSPWGPAPFRVPSRGDPASPRRRRPDRDTPAGRGRPASSATYPQAPLCTVELPDQHAITVCSQGLRRLVLHRRSTCVRPDRPRVVHKAVHTPSRRFCGSAARRCVRARC